MKDVKTEIYYGVAHSPFGWCLVGITKQGIYKLSFLKSRNGAEVVRAIKDLQQIHPKAIIMRDDKRIISAIKKVFARSSSKIKNRMPLVFEGTPFQIKVWNALLKVPKGQVTTYTQIAKNIGSPRAVRAVGSACGKNPIGFLIPCHRVLTKNSKLGGYHWGIARKKALLAWEGIRV